MFNWGFIGYGSIAVSVAKQLKGSDNRIVAVYGRNTGKAEKFAKKYHAKTYQDIESFLNDEEIDGVYIATPNDSHAYYCEKCIEHHLPVLCEKPFAVNYEEAKKVIDLAKKEDVYITEAMWTWHNEVTLKVKEWIDEGKIGDIQNIKGSYAFPMADKKDTTSRLISPDRAGGCLLDIGIYPIRYVYGMFGMPDKIEANGRLYNGVDIEETIFMDYGSFKAELLVSFDTFKGEKMYIEGKQGSIDIPLFHMADKAVLKTDKKEKAKGGKFGLCAYREEFDHMAQDIAEGRKESPYVPLNTTLDTMKMLDEIRRQLGVDYPMEK